MICSLMFECNFSILVEIARWNAGPHRVWRTGIDGQGAFSRRKKSAEGFTMAESSKAGDDGIGMFWIVPRVVTPLRRTLTLVPGGKGSGLGSVLLD